MKRFFFHAFILAILPVLLFAQEKPAAATEPAVNLLLGRAKVESLLNPRLADKIESQLASVMAQGEATYGGNFSVFVLTPTVAVLERGQMEGLQTRQTVKLNLNLRVTNTVTGEIFGSADLMLSGSGTSTDDAASRALAGIRSNNSTLLKQIEGFQTKISNYYRDNCAGVQAIVKSREAEQDLSGALTLLHSVPAGTACATEIAGQKATLFKQIQDKNCQTLLQRADAQSGLKNFPAALVLLAQADVKSSCAPEVKKRIAELESKVQEEQKTQYEWLFKFWAAGAEAEKARWNALTAYCLDWMRRLGKGDLAPR